MNAPNLTPSSPPKLTKVLSVDDSADIAQLTQRFVSRQDDMVGVGALHTAHDLAAHALRLEADVVILDLGMPGPDPLAAARTLRDQTPCRFVVLSGRDDPDTISSARSAGASGFVGKDADMSQILAAVRKVAAGGTSFPAPGRW